MNFTAEANDVMRKLELGAPNIDESKFPDVFNQHIDAIEECKTAYEQAQRKEAVAKEKVNVVLRGADRLIAEAKGAGQHTARERGWGIFKHTRKRDEIDATQRNLKELIDCGIHTAEAQKELVNVQQALAESQTALLNVQKTQMTYQKQTTEAMQFLYMLGAYNMGASQSILINLEATLKGASKEKLGEMAKQQLLMAMDQIKNQENILVLVRENKRALGEINKGINNLDEKFEQLYLDSQQQDELIAENVEKISDHAKKLEEIEADDDKQDELIAKNAEKISDHAKKLEEMEADDDKQDELIAKNAEKISGHAKKLEEIEADDDKQDELIAINKREIAAIKKTIAQQKEDINVLENRIAELEQNARKIGWKITISLVAVGALVIEVLNLVGIL